MSQPFISLIMPIRNESAYIEQGLRAIRAQDYPTDHMEVLIVDGMSTDNTRTIVNDFAALHPQMQILVLDNPDKIVPTAMNIAIKEAKGDIIIRVDGHCIIAPDYLRKCVEHLQLDGVDAVGGALETIGETNMAKVIAICISAPFGVGNSTFRTLSGRTMLVDTVPFPAYTRKIIEQAGFYDEELVRNQDDEYNYRIREIGGKILQADDIRSKYFSRTSLMGLWRQYYQYGYWKVRVLQKHACQMRLRQFVPPVFVLALITFPLHAFSPTLQPLSMVVFLLYVFANVLASLFTASKRGWKYLPILPITFAILHLSYGAGFLIGLVKFWNRWGDKTGKTPRWSGESVG